MPHSEQERSQHLFVVRVWNETSSVVPISQWRGSVEHVTTGQRQFFADLQEIDRFIRSELNEGYEATPGAEVAPAASALLTPEQVALVQRSLRCLQPALDTVVDLFYARLFALKPELRSLFVSEMTGMRARFGTMLTVIVEGLHDYPTVAHIVQNLGQRHADYGVQKAHFRPFGDALLWALQHADGPCMTPATLEAWQVAWRQLAQTMTASIQELPSPPAVG